ncbi:MAG: hypothetical protein ACHREM_12355 [Polyangiales bacterium]
MRALVPFPATGQTVGMRPRLGITVLLLATSACPRAVRVEPTSAPIVVAPVSSSSPSPSSSSSSSSVAGADAAVDAVVVDPSIAIRTRISDRFAFDAAAAALALDLFDRAGDEVDVLPAQTIDGGYRGTISLVPALPIDGDRKHLTWVHDALVDFDALFAAIGARATPKYRWHSLTLRFYKSVGDTTPNAFASDWTISYNVVGSIDKSAEAVRETLFHELFHLNDADHGDWSTAHLKSVQAAIEHKCGTSISCLAPFAPTSTIVRRGTYYAFQPGNDEREYAAEVALRWYREQRAITRKEPPIHPAFKCGPSENGTAWRAIADEFFGGVDLVSACR